MTAAVSLHQLARHFPGAKVPAVAGIDLDVSRGETLCLVGPSGCGKSTTLRLIAGLDTPSAGRITIDGRDMTGVPPQARDVAMVFQGFALYPHLRVRQILEFPLKMRRVPRGRRGETIERAADMLGLRPLMDRYPAELSGGERQRVAMGRAIVRQPRVFLFDEPLSNLDASLRVSLRGELGRLLAELEATAVYVTHDQAEAMTLGHRIALLRSGQIEQVDTPRRIYEVPRTEFAATFFGTPPMNVLPVERDGNRARVGGWVLPCPEQPVRLRLGIRPEHVEVLARADAPSEGLLVSPARIRLIEPMGAETHLTVDVAGIPLRVRSPGFSEHSRDERLSLGLRPERVRWFDADTGVAL